MARLLDGKYMGIGLTKSVKVLEGDKNQPAGAYVVTDGMPLLHGVFAFGRIFSLQ